MATSDINPYACLGLMPGSSPAEIKRRYRQLAKQHHPDRNGHSAECEEKLLALNAAYAFLSDPARKSAYDARFEAIFCPALPSRAAAPRTVPPLRPAAVPVVALCRRRAEALRAVAGLALLMLTSLGIVFTAADASSAFTLPASFLSLLPQSTVAGSAPAPAFSFVVTRETFDSPAAPPAWKWKPQP